MHSCSNLCYSNVTSMYYVSKKYLNNLTFNFPKIDFSNPAKLSSSGGIFARAGFLPDLEKVPDSSRSQSRNPVQPYKIHTCTDDKTCFSWRSLCDWSVFCTPCQRLFDLRSLTWACGCVQLTQVLRNKFHSESAADKSNGVSETQYNPVPLSSSPSRVKKGYEVDLL